MSHTRNHTEPRAKLLKLVSRYTGWVGEECNRAAGRKFLKRLARRTNRRALNQNLYLENPPTA